jgi:hypothetical protein
MTRSSGIGTRSRRSILTPATPPNLPIADGRVGEVAAYVVHAGRTDRNVGKMTAMLEVRNDLVTRSSSALRRDGSDGDLHQGVGHGRRRVVGDFIAGAARSWCRKRPRTRTPFSWRYRSLSIGLLGHVTCCTAVPRLILCYQASRDYIGDYYGRVPWVKIPARGAG